MQEWHEIRVVLLNIQLEELKRTINALDGSSYDGADLYVNTVSFIENWTLQCNFAT